MKVEIVTRFSVGDVVRVVSDARWANVEFEVEAIDISWSTREDSVYRQDADGTPRNVLIEYHGMVARNTSWGFYEDQVEKSNTKLIGFTWDVKEGDVIAIDNGEWTITDIKTEWEGGGWVGNMGSAIDPGTPHTFLILRKDDTTRRYELLDNKPVKVVNHKRKVFV